MVRPPHSLLRQHTTISRPRVRELEDFGSALRIVVCGVGLRSELSKIIRSLIEKKKLAALESFKEKSAAAPAAEPEATAASSA